MSRSWDVERGSKTPSHLKLFSAERTALILSCSRLMLVRRPLSFLKTLARAQSSSSSLYQGLESGVLSHGSRPSQATYLRTTSRFFVAASLADTVPRRAPAGTPLRADTMTGRGTVTCRARIALPYLPRLTVLSICMLARVRPAAEAVVKQLFWSYKETGACGYAFMTVSAP